MAPRERCAPLSVCPRILLTAPYGYALRNIGVTGLVSRLADRGCDVIVASSYCSEDLRAFPEYGADRVSYVPYRYQPPLYPLARALNTAATMRLYARIGNPTYDIMSENWNLTDRRAYLLSQLARQPLPRSKALYELNSWLLDRTVRAGAFLDRSQSAIGRPDVVVSTVPFLPDEQYVLAQHRSDAVTVGFLLSWDNVTSKGRLPRFDHYIVWNDIMRAELEEAYGVTRDRIEVVGVPQMDYYTDPTLILPRAEFLARYGIEPDEKVILYATGFSGFADEFEVAKTLATRVAPAVDGHRCRVIIRHRMYLEHFVRYFEDSGAILNWGCRNVDVAAKDYQTIFYTHEDMVEWANLLAHADVLVNACSTVILDAAFLDRPIISVAFDGDHDRPYYASIKRLFEYAHLRPIVRSGGVRLVASYDELRCALQAYLDDPTLDREGRARIRAEQLQFCDGGSIDRVVDFLHYLGSAAAMRSEAAKPVMSAERGIDH